LAKITHGKEIHSIRASRQSSGNVTLENVAKLAGVAPTTVSRALNHPEKVAKKTLDRVRETIARTGYVPNLLAGGLASKRSRLIAAIVPSMVNLVYVETIQGFDEGLRKNGYQVLMGASGYDLESEEELVATILSRRPEAIFLTGIQHTLNCRKQLLAAGIPIVETWEITPSPLDLVVGFSHEMVGQAVAAYLHDRGYSRFATVSAEDRRALVRNKAFEHELNRRGIRNVASGMVSAVSSMQRGREGFVKLLGQGFQGGAIFCSSDTLAQGVIAEAQSRRLKIPEDFSIVGFGDQNFAAYTYPSLTTVKIDRLKMGQLAAQSLLARLQGKQVERTVMDVGFSIVERDTA